jgi:predicted deacylase
MTEYVAYKIIEDLTGSDLCIDIHASNIFLTEIPQIRINELHKDKLVPLAMEMNVDFVWVHGASTVLESTLAYSLNSIGTPTLVVEMGVGMRITRCYCDQLVNGIFNTMKNLGIWQGEIDSVRTPIVADEASGVVFFNAPKAGIFIPTAKHWEMLEVGDEVGRVVNPLKGEVLSTIISNDRGILFTIREYPVVDEGSLIGRLLKR